MDLPMDPGDGLETQEILFEKAIVPLTFDCDTIEDLQAHLREVVEVNLRSLIPTRISAHLYLSPHAIVKTLPPKKSGKASPGNSSAENAAPEADNQGMQQSVHQRGMTDPMNPTGNFVVSEVITDRSETDSSVQSGIARFIVASIKGVDGFGWSLKSKSRTRKHGWQIEHFCQDSQQNRDRRRNSIRKSKVSTDPYVKATGMPTYDCRGSIIVMFSSTLGKILVKYAHSPIHRTIASRKETRSSNASLSKRDPWTIPSAGTHYNTGESGLGQSHQDVSLDQNSQSPGIQTELLSYHAPNEEIRSRALVLLSDNAIDVNSLSQEQLIAFENQHHLLQGESLKLFQEHGLANLYIITYQSRDRQITQCFRPRTTLPLAPISGGMPLISDSQSEPPQPISQPEPQQNGGNDLRSTPLVEDHPAKKTRSKSGCWKCRNDRVKCNEEHPICKRCTEYASTCEWPTPKPHIDKQKPRRPQ